MGILNALMVFIGFFTAGVLDGSNVVAWITLTAFAYAVWVYARSISLRNTWSAFSRGFLFGLLTLAVVRLFGLIGNIISIGESRLSDGFEYNLFEGQAADMARILLDGSWSQSLSAIFGIALLTGVAVALTYWIRRSSFLIADVTDSYKRDYLRVPLAAVLLGVVVIVGSSFISDKSTKYRLEEFYLDGVVARQADALEARLPGSTQF
ncbi:MAG: hypothetical protein AAF413_02535 [Patescibacteria group bacterium]